MTKMSTFPTLVQTTICFALLSFWSNMSPSFHAVVLVFAQRLKELDKGVDVTEFVRNTRQQREEMDSDDDAYDLLAMLYPQVGDPIDYYNK